MGNGNEERPDELPRDDRAVGASALDAAKGYIEGSTGAGCACDGSREAFVAAFTALLEWGEANALIRRPGDFPLLARHPDARGHEHEAWFDEESNRWFKATYPNRFGLAWGRAGSATTLEYLTRLVLQNTYFADDVRLVALLECDSRMRILTSQPHIAGGPAAAAEIRDWFIGLGFICLNAGQSVAWYRAKENLLIADAHEGNIIKSQGGVLVPIDLNIIQPRGELLAWAHEGQCP